MTNFNTTANLGDVITTANALSGGYLFNALIVVVFAVLFTYSLVFGRNKALLYSSFMTFLLLLVMIISGWITDYSLIIVDGVLLVAALFMIYENKQG